jgi:hypothetical protein
LSSLIDCAGPVADIVKPPNKLLSDLVGGGTWREFYANRDGKSTPFIGVVTISISH